MISAVKSSTSFAATRHRPALLHQKKLNEMGFLTLMSMTRYGKTLDWMMSMTVLLHDG
jgi:hypothetical protein